MLWIPLCPGALFSFISIQNTIWGTWEKWLRPKAMHIPPGKFWICLAGSGDLAAKSSEDDGAPQRWWSLFPDQRLSSGTLGRKICCFRLQSVSHHCRRVGRSMNQEIQGPTLGSAKPCYCKPSPDPASIFPEKDAKKPKSLLRQFLVWLMNCWSFLSELMLMT